MVLARELVVGAETVLRTKRPPRRGMKEIDLDIVKVISTGHNWQTGIMYAANINHVIVKKELSKLIAQGYIVMVDFDIARMKEQEEGLSGKRYAITERSRMWMIIAEREDELAPK